MRTFATRHAPSSFDGPSNYISWDRAAEDEIASWLVLPCGRNRDSDTLTESNWHSALKMLGGEGDNVQIHRFGHWACGWYELIIVRPETKESAIAGEIEESLDGYPVLDESDFSDRECVEADRLWESFSVKERIECVRRHGADCYVHSFADLLGAIRGKWCPINPSELLG